MLIARERISWFFVFLAAILAAVFLACDGLAKAAEGDFSVVLLPDTQNYSESFPESYTAQTEWIVKNRDKENIRFVIHLGDIVNKYAPDKKTLDWANEVLLKYADRRAIVATHAYLDTKNRNPIGTAIWDQLVRKHKTVFLVVCGHVIGTNMLKAESDDGQTVHEMLVDYQGEANGGDGWLRILRFSPAENKIFVRDYSPTLGRFKDGEAANFSLEYQMMLREN